jgi:hypothetical protein
VAEMSGVTRLRALQEMRVTETEGGKVGAILFDMGKPVYELKVN